MSRARAALGLVAWLQLSCCAAQSADARVRTALEVMGEVIDPAYSLAMDGCIAREEIAVVRAERGDPTGRAQYEATKARCADIREAFETMRVQHHQAATLVERGAVDEAEAQLELVRHGWRQLQVAEEQEGGGP